MATLTISLPDDRAEFAREQALRKGFDTVDAYVDAVLGDIQAREASKNWKPRDASGEAIGPPSAEGSAGHP